MNVKLKDRKQIVVATDFGPLKNVDISPFIVTGAGCAACNGHWIAQGVLWWLFPLSYKGLTQSLVELETCNGLWILHVAGATYEWRCFRETFQKYALLVSFGKYNYLYACLFAERSDLTLLWDEIIMCRYGLISCSEKAYHRSDLDSDEVAPSSKIGRRWNHYCYGYRWTPSKYACQALRKSAKSIWGSISTSKYSENDLADDVMIPTVLISKEIGDGIIKCAEEKTFLVNILQ